MRDQVTIVTGATGFAGGHLLDRLRSQTNIVAWHRPGGRPPDERSEVVWQSVDITDAKSVAKAVAESAPSRVFHLAGAPNVAMSWQNAVSHLRTNALGTHHVLDAVRVHRPECRVLVVSSAHVYKPEDAPISEDAPLRPSNPYGFSKLAQDQMALRAAVDEQLDVVVARPFNHIGPRQQAGFAIANFARQIVRIERGLAEPILRVGNLDARRDITDVRDVVEAYVRVMEDGRPGRPYNVCSGRAWRMQDLLDGLLSLSTAAIATAVDSARLRPHDAPVIQGDGTRIHAELGWSPTIGIEQTLRDTLDGWRTDPAL